MNNPPTPILPFIQERLESTKKEIKDDLFLWLSGKKFPNLEFSGSLPLYYWGPYLDEHVKKIIDTAFATNKEIATEHGLDPSKSVNDGTTAAEQTIKEILNLMADYDRRMRGKGYPESIPPRDIKEFWSKHSESVRTRAKNEYNLLSISKKEQSTEVPNTSLDPLTDQSNNEKKAVSNFLLSHWQWVVMFVLTVIGCIFNYPTFHQFIKQASTTESQKEPIETKIYVPETINIPNKFPPIAKERVDKWRKEVQSFSNGGTFYKDRFLKSNTYFELQQYLSKNMMKRLSDPSIHLITGPNQTQVDTDILINLNVELDRIATQ